MLDANDVVAGIYMMDFASDAARHIRKKIDARLADIHERHIAPQRRVVMVPLQNIAKIADARRRKCLDRPRRDRVDADVLLAEIGGGIMHLTFQPPLAASPDL